MARIRQTIDLGVPAHAAYRQLLRFEDYPRFLQEVAVVRRNGSAHLHWSVNLSYQSLEWDAEITEELPDRCIAWHSDNGPISDERVELQPLGPGKTRLTLTMDCDPLQLVPAQDGSPGLAVEERLRQDLERFRIYVETSEADAAAAAAHEMNATTREMGAAMRGVNSAGGGERPHES
jgi:uncharacterized membrane protein